MIWAGISDETWLLLCWRVLLHNVGSSFWLYVNIILQHHPFLHQSLLLIEIGCHFFITINMLVNQMENIYFHCIHQLVCGHQQAEFLMKLTFYLLLTSVAGHEHQPSNLKLLCNNSYIALPLVDHATFSSLPYPHRLLLTAWNHNLKRNQYRWPSVTGLK